MLHTIIITTALAFVALLPYPVSALKPRWTPPKPVRVETVDPAFYNRDCINFKFVEGSRVRLRNNRLTSLVGWSLDGIDSLLSSFRIRDVQRLFSASEAKLEAGRIRGEGKSGKQLSDLNNWYRLILDSSQAPEPVIEGLLSLKIIEDAHANPIPALAEDIEPPTDDFTDGQVYLYNAPEGIDAPAAWEIEGGLGAGVKIIDIEGDWNWDHEDLKEPFFWHNAGDWPWGTNHGNAVMGILAGQHNQYGINGICPDAEIGGWSVREIFQNEWPNISEAINNTSAQLDEGDIFLIELQGLFEGYNSPMETWQENFDAIETATANGIICCEAAGNDSFSLDSQVYEGRFDPENRHSGAILVGAGNPPGGNQGSDRSRCAYSNYGQRVDLQGQGYEVTTTGYGHLFNPNNDYRQRYTGQFSGTSSATPIVAGAAACLQGIYKAATNGQLILTGRQIRDLLVETGSPQAEDDEDEHIGPRPNLADAIQNIQYKTCSLNGMVTDALSGVALPGVLVATNNNFSDITDDQGVWRIENAIAEIEFSITASIPGYLDSTISEIIVDENEEVEINFELLHSEFLLSDSCFSAQIYKGEQVEYRLRITNSGNGPLVWSAEKRLEGEQIDPWTLRRSFYFGEATGEDRIEGAVFADDRFFVASSNRQHGNSVYVFSREGNLVDTLEQFNREFAGYRDLEWDGEFIWGSGSETVWGFTTNNELVYEWRSGFGQIHNIAYDPEENILWLSSITSDYRAYDVEGNFLDRTIRKPAGFRTYGLAWWSQDPEDYNLYILQKGAGESAPLVYRINVFTGDTIRATQITLAEDASGLTSATVTSRYDINSWEFMTVVDIPENARGDRLDIYQMDGRKDWMSIDLMVDTLGVNESSDLTITLKALPDLPDTSFWGQIIFTHNAAEGATTLWLEMTIMPVPPAQPFNLLLPIDGDTLIANPMPGESPSFPPVDFVWESVRPFDQSDDVNYRFILEDATGMRYETATIDTMVSLSLDTLDPVFDLGAPLVWEVLALVGHESQPCIRPFYLIIASNDVSIEPINLRVFAIESIFPNPFNSSTTISYSLPSPGRYAFDVVDIQGRLVTRLSDGWREAGSYREVLNGGGLVSGCFVIRLQNETTRNFSKIQFVK